jgi:hypothetical protein
MIGEMAASLPNSGGVISWFTGENDMNAFGAGLTSFGNAISGFADSVSNMAAANLSGAITQINQLLDLIQNMSGVNIDAITSFESSLSNIGTSGVTAFVTAFEGSSLRVAAAGNNMITSLIDAIKKSGVRVYDVARSVAINAATFLRNAYTSFHSAGAHLAQGFANGISENAYKAAAKAKAMAEAAVMAARNALDINSPSKVFAKLGSSVPEGFARGIGKFTGDIEDSSVAMARVAISGTRDAIARVSELLNADVDSQPTIRPVLDLSDIESGAGRINGLFGMQPSVDLLTNVGSINTMMNGRQNGVNTTNDDVVAAIKDLKNAIRESSGDSYSINGITYDDGSNIADTIKSLVRVSRIEGRI